MRNRYRVTAYAGIAVSVLALLANLGFFFRAGVSEVLAGLAYNGFVLAWMLLLTVGSRTVPLMTLGIYWLLGIWVVTALGYLLQAGTIAVLGLERTDHFVPVWLASITEEGLKTLAVVLYFVLACRDGRRWPSITDGMLVGFVVGFGLKFHEDAHIGTVTGHGWNTDELLSNFLPTIEVWNTLVYNDHAVRGALEGLSVAAAAMFWHWRRVALAAGLIGPALMFWGHVMWNHLADDPAAAAGAASAPFPYGLLRAVLFGGRLPLAVLLVGAVVAVVAELFILRWVGKRDPVFPPLAWRRLLGLLGRWNTAEGRAQLAAAKRYVTLRRSVYYAAWRTRRAGGRPDVSDADYGDLTALANRLADPSRPAPAMAR